MESQADRLEQIRVLVRAGQYRVRLHAVRHMIEEGFDENQLLEAIEGKLMLLEEHPDEARLLVLGYFSFTSQTPSPLHIVFDASAADLVDIVTAYIPQRPWWESPTQRGTGKK
jgi:hypothetical protein